MAKVDPNTSKRHWFLAVWSAPQIGAYVPMSAYVCSDKRSLTIPQINAAKDQRKAPDGSVLVNVAYIGYMSQYELTGTSAAPVPTTVTAAYTLGLEQALTVPHPATLVNAFPPSDEFQFAEWEAGRKQGMEMLTKINPVSAHVPSVGTPL